jgi:VWFA-related protein
MGNEWDVPDFPISKDFHSLHSMDVVSMMPFKSLFFLVSILLLCVGNASESPMPQGRHNTAIKADVALVPVDVMVRDKEGGYIGNLQAKDFAVYDNGVAQKIDLFSHNEMPLDVALVVDAGYWNHPLELQKAATTVFQLLNPKQDRVALFCAGAWIVGSAYQLTGLTQDRFLIGHQLENTLNLSGSSIKDELWEAALYLRSKGDPHRRRAIILISGNIERTAPLHSYKETLDEILEEGAILYSIQTAPFFNVEEWPPSIDTVAELWHAANFTTRERWRWWDEKGAANMRPSEEEIYAAMPEWKEFEEYRAFKTFGKGLIASSNAKEVALMAEETGGDVLIVSSAPDLPNAVNTAIVNLKHSYTLGFYPSVKGAEDTYHTLKVKVDSHAGYRIQARKGYYIHDPAASTLEQMGQTSDGHSQNPNSNNRYVSAMARFNFVSNMPRLLEPRYVRNMDNLNGSDLAEIYLIHEKLDWTNGKPSPDAVKYGLKHIDFTAVAKNNANLEGETSTKIDLRINAAQVFFDFFDNRYRAFLYVCILQGNKPVGKVRTYLVSYPEEGFGRAIQSNISLSITMKPSKHKDIRILIFQYDYPHPPWGSYGIQPVQYQP